MSSSIRSVLLLAVVALAACNRDRDRASPAATEHPGTTTVTGANVLANTTAVGRIVDARCARESSCNNIGHDKKYVTQEACGLKIKADMVNDLNAQECPNGIDQKELDECLAEIRAESCNNPIDTIERLATCRRSELCPKTSAPNR